MPSDLVDKETRQCRKKIAHATREQAQAAMEKCHGVGNPHIMEVYECPHCKLWHVGHNWKKATAA